MAQYTTLDRITLDTLLDNYSLGSLSDFTSLEGGQANSSTVISTDSGKYVVSVCDEKNPEELSFLTQTLEHLEKYGIATTRLIRTRDGGTFIEYGGKPVYIKEFIEGSVPIYLTPAMAYQVGIALAQLHSVTSLDYLAQSFPYGIESFSEILKEQGEFPGWLRNKSQHLAQCIDPELPRGLIHGDLFCDNTVFQGENLVALLDFEEVCNYFLIFDLGMCAAGCCCPAGELSLDLIASLAGGYQSIRPLTEREKNLLKLHIEYGAVATAFWRFRQYNIRVPDIGKQDAYREMSERADAISSISPDEFMQTVFSQQSSVDVP